MVSDIIIRAHRFAANTTTGTQSVTTPKLDGKTPKAVLFFAGFATSDDTAVDEAVFSIGAADGTRQWVTSGRGDHGIATSDEHRRGATDECIMLLDTNGGIEGEANFSQFLTDGVEINWGNAPSTAVQIIAIFFAGDDLNAYADTLNLANSNTDVTAPGFEPDLVFVGCPARPMDDVADSTAYFNVGIGCNDGADTTRLYAIRYRNSRSVAEPSAAISTSDAVAQQQGGGFFWNQGITTYDANGFTFTDNAGNPGTDDAGYLAIEVGDRQVWCGSLDAPTSTGDDSQTGPGFKPQIVSVCMTMLETENSHFLDANAGAFGCAYFDDSDIYSNCFAHEDAETTMDTQSVTDSALNLKGDDGSNQFKASFVSFDTNGWTLNFSTATPSVAKKWIGWAVEEVPAAGAPMLALMGVGT